MSYYHQAQVCQNGHLITAYFDTSPVHAENYCHLCGAPTISACPACKTPIRGEYESDSIVIIGSSTFPVPAFCHNCGNPYPWTALKLQAAKDLSDEIEDISQTDRDLLKKSLDDIVRDTPQTPVSALRFKKLVAKASTSIASGFRDILIDIASEAAKKIIWPT